LCGCIIVIQNCWNIYYKEQVLLYV
jgi:hypothetical protein